MIHQSIYYPSTEFKKWLIWSIFLYSCLVFNVLEPFEISIKSFNPAYHIILCGHGVVSAITVYFLESKIEPILSKKPWSFLQSLSWLVALVFIVSVVNWLYILSIHYTIGGWNNIQVPNRGFSYIMPKFVSIYMVWGFICGLSAIFLFKKEAVLTKQNDQVITLLSDNQADHFKLNAAHIICFKTCDNYLELFYLSEDKQLKTRMIRSSMKRMILQLDAKQFLRSHQSYLVNKSYLKGLVKVKNQSFLELAYLDFNVNVSRNNLKQFKTLLAS